MASAPRRHKVWIVDDSPLDARRAKEVISRRHEVETLGDGAAVLERLATERGPDLLILDWMMPGITGLEVCRHLRAGGGRPELPILLLTGRNASDEVVQGLEAGANDFVSKPFLDEELLARTNALLRTKELLDRAEAAEANVRALLEKAPDAILVVDAQGMVTYLNEEAVRVLGEHRSALGKPVGQLLPGMPPLSVVVGPGEPLLPLPDVQVGDRIYSPTIRLLPNDDAERTTVSLRDVSEQRRAELRRLDFYAIIAHDLRTPLTSSLMRLELIFAGKHGLLPSALLGDLRKMERHLQSLVGMINDFLELARFEGVGRKLERERVDLDALFRNTMDEYRPLLDNSGLSWRVGEHEPAQVMGDRRRLTQVISNLIGNAIKFTPRGGVVRTSVRNHRGYVEAQVEDSGRGIPTDQIPSLFQRYRRATDGHSEVIGSGLGLMIVREIIEAHGGHVGVESSEGRGSRFWFRLPSIPVE